MSREILPSGSGILLSLCGCADEGAKASVGDALLLVPIFSSGGKCAGGVGLRECAIQDLTLTLHIQYSGGCLYFPHFRQQPLEPYPVHLDIEMVPKTLVLHLYLWFQKNQF